MTRSELSAILSDLIRRNAITLDDARATLARFDDGDLTDLPIAAPPVDAQNEWVLALALVLFILRRNTGRPLSTNERKRVQKLLRARYESNIARLAAAVSSFPEAPPYLPGDSSVSEWYAGMQISISDYTRQMAVAGAGTLPRATVQATVDANLAAQWPYLATFAAQIAVGLVVGVALSEAAILSRSKLYGGVAYDAFWRGAEPDPAYGQIVYYDSLDTGSTCSPCSAAARGGPYLAGSGHPFPGSVCLGGSRCRCTLRFEYNPSIYEQLSGS